MDKELPAEPLMDTGADEIPGYEFTSPDPYARCTPLPEGHTPHRIRFDEEGHIIVKNPSACWFPDLTVQREIDGTIYSVTGSYDGSETLDEIEAGYVSTVIVKDLSRFGRNSALTGMYTNITFAKYGVRFIAINDNYDTIDPNSVDNDFAGTKNWFNEFYARDTSRKIRAVNKAKAERGEPLNTRPPYGYRKDPDDHKRWIVDEEAAQVVKHIFTLCMEGCSPVQIAKALENEKVLNPTAYHQHEGKNTPHPAPEKPYQWNVRTIVTILERGEGHLSGKGRTAREQAQV